MDVTIRAIPYPPNFNKIAASTIEPAIGASTCALGSHKWERNIGSFTRNPIIVISQNKLLMVNEDGNKISDDIVINLWPEFIIIEQNITNIGRDAVIVYIIRYIFAWSRSGWYPHIIIITIVGIRDASNQI